MPSNSNQDSNSSEQKVIEEKIVAQISKDLGVEFQTGSQEIQGVNFQIDFANFDRQIIGEVYAGIDELKPGQKRKIATDILKLITVEKLMGIEFQKWIVLVDNKIESSLLGDSWITKAIEIFKVDIKVIILSNEQMTSLREVKVKQGIKFKKAN